MTSLIDRPSKARGKAPSPKVAMLPQVNLLPSEVRAARGLRTVQRWLAVAMAAVVVACAAGWFVAHEAASAAQSDLAKAQRDTVRLTQEQAKYAEVPRVQNQLQQAESARSLGMSTEIIWKPYMDAITAVLPAQTSLDSLVFAGQTPMALGTAATNPLQEPAVGQLTFVARSLGVPDAAALMRSLDSIPGFGDSYVTTVQVQQDQDSGVFYRVEGTVQVRSGAFSHRFDAGTSQLPGATPTATTGSH